MIATSLGKRLAVFLAVFAVLALPQPPFAMTGTVSAAATSALRNTVPTLGGVAPLMPSPPRFVVPKVAATSNGPQQLAAGDFNNDQKPDLAVTTSAGVDILLGNGDGTFQAPVTYSVGNSVGA